LTDGRTYIKAVDISADGEKVVYSAGSADFDKLYLAPTANPDMAMRLTDGAYNDIAPSFSLDGRTVYYSSDERGAYNICSLDLESRTICRLSDVRTGNFFPVEIPGEKGTLVISSFHKGSFLLFKKDATTSLARRTAEFSGPRPKPRPSRRTSRNTSRSRSCSSPICRPSRSRSIPTAASMAPPT
jgi:hypothetical protein